MHLRGWAVAKSLSAMVVIINSAIAPSTMAVCCRRENSDHRLFFRDDLPSTDMFIVSCAIGTLCQMMAERRAPSGISSGGLPTGT